MRHAPLREFGRRIRLHRQKAGITQEGLADRAGVHRTYAGSVERGERNVSLVNILRLARALHVDPGVLIRGLGA